MYNKYEANQSSRQQQQQHTAGIMCNTPVCFVFHLQRINLEAMIRSPDTEIALLQDE
jgi:hypothetical protein